LNELIGVGRKTRREKNSKMLKNPKKNAMGKRLIRTCAMCYFNLLSGSGKIVVSLLALTTPPKSKPSKKHQALMNLSFAFFRDRLVAHGVEKIMACPGEPSNHGSAFPKAFLINGLNKPASLRSAI